MPSAQAVTFGRFQFFPRQRLLLDQERPVALGSRALDILGVLIEHAGQTVSKDTLLGRVWPGITVDETSLRVHIAALRKSLRDGLDGNRYISNIPGRGYSFVAPLEIGQVAAAEPPAHVAPLPSPSLGTLPTQITRIVGRDEILRLLAEQQQQRRLLTITGPGGIGKTTVVLAVAKAVASRYRDGIVYVDLSPVSDASFVPGTLAAALGVALHPENPVSSLVAAVRDRQLLVVFDSCEHVIDAAAELATNLLRYTEGISVLATSREALRADGEWVHRMPPLAIPQSAQALTAAQAMQFPAVQLFVERAAESRGGYTLSDADAPLVADICRSLDGIALAIELAAGRTNTVAVQDLTAQIDDRFRILRHGRRTALPRHQTLKATLDWSYDWLPPIEQQLLNRLSIFSGGFDLSAAATVCAGGPLAEGEIPDGVVDLVEKSLVSTSFDDASVTYRLLDTMRVYARERLDASGERQGLAERHARYVCALLDGAAAEAEALSSIQWLARYVPHIENLRAALRWAFSKDGDVALGVSLTSAAMPLWSQLSLADESLEWVERALQASSSLPERNRRREMQLHAALGGLQMYAISSVQQSTDAWDAALGIATELNDTDYQLRALRALWAHSINDGEFRLALSYAERFARVALEANIVAEQIVSDRLIGTAEHFLGEHDKASVAIERMIGRYAASGDRTHMVRYQFNQSVSARIVRGRILWLRGQTDSALRDLEENVTDTLALDHTMSLCNVLAQSSCPIAILAGELDVAARYVDLLHHTEAQALNVFYTYAVCFEAELIMLRGDVEGGLARFEPALAELQRSGFGHYLVSFLATRARGLMHLGRFDAAGQAVDEALSLCQRTGARWNLPELHRLKGEIALHRHGGRDAASAFRLAIKLAREQKALAWELRAACSLVEARPRDRAARKALADVLAQYSDGTDRPEVRKAASLL